MYYPVFHKKIISLLFFNTFINYYIPNVIKNSHIFVFANDLKLVKIINIKNDTIDLQTDFNNIQTWCLTNRLSLNIDKCIFMRFNLIKNTIDFNYSISNLNVELLTNFKNPGAPGGCYKFSSTFQRGEHYL